MTSTFTRIALAIAVVLSVTAFAQNGGAATAALPATAAPSPAASVTTKLGIIDIQRAILTTNEGKRDFDTLNKKFEPKQTELSRANTEIQDLQKQLQAQGDKMNEDAHAALVKNIEQKQRALQQNAEAAQTDFQGEQNEIATRIGKKFMSVLDKYAKDNGYSVILDVSNPQTPVLWANMQQVDVTEAVVTAYNAQAGVAAPTTASTAPSATRPAGTAGVTGTTAAPRTPAASTGTTAARPKPTTPTTPKQ
jgi:outer membrane protein